MWSAFMCFVCCYPCRGAAITLYHYRLYILRELSDLARNVLCEELHLARNVLCEELHLVRNALRELLQKKAPQINAMLCGQIDIIKSSIYWLLFFVRLSSFASASSEILTYKTFDLLLSLRPLPSRKPPQLFSVAIVIVFIVRKCFVLT